MNKIKQSMMATVIAAVPVSAVIINQYSTLHCGMVFDQSRLTIIEGIDSDTLNRLKTERSVDSTAICHMPIAKLERALYRLEQPKPDHPGEARAFRYQQQLSHDNNNDKTLNIENWKLAREQVDFAKQNIHAAAGISPSSWESLGPGNIGGRVRSFAFDPDDSDRIYAGSVSGGVWLTENAGTSWSPTDDFMANLSVSTIIFDPTDSNVIYAGTGEGTFNFDNVRGLGIFKSDDKGQSWSSIASTANNSSFYWVNRLTMLNDSSRLLAATQTGIWTSENEGVSWTQSHSGRSNDVDVHPNDNNLLIGGTWGGALYSTDGGSNWTSATGLSISGSSRVEVAYAKSNPDIVFVSADNNSGEVWKSTDGGQTYSQVNTGYSYLGSQGWYDNALWVDPLDENHIIVGGLDLWRSTDGGATMIKISTWWQAPSSAHADHHFILEHPDYDGVDNKRVFFANDGGIYETPDIEVALGSVGWQELNNNLAITQFYGMAVSPDGTVIGGTQDNGTLIYKNDSENWTTTFGGDGGFSAADPTDSNYVYGEYVYLQIHRSTNGGNGSSNIFDAQMENDGANFIAPFILDPNNENRLLGGGDRLWVSNNAKDVTPTWTTIKDAIPSSSPISAIAVAQDDANLIYVGHNDGSLYKSTNGTDPVPIWTQVASVSMPGRYLMRVAIDPVDNEILFASFGGYEDDNLWKSTDAGVTWTESVGIAPSNIPPAPIRSVLIHPVRTSHIYVGTEVGIFSSTDGGASWDLENNGPANVSVDELVWGEGELLYAATHGRGIFRANVFDEEPDDLNFETQNNAALSAILESNQQTINGLGFEVELSIVDGEYSLGCSGIYSSDTIQVNNGEIICLRHTSAAEHWTTVTTQLTVGSSTFSFESRTIADITPDSFSFDSVQDVALSTISDSNTITVNGISNEVDVSIVDGEYSIGCDTNSFTSVAGTILLDETLCIRHITSSEHFVTTTTVVTIGDSSASFESTTLPDTTPDDFSFVALDDVNSSSVQTSEIITATGFQVDIPISVSGGEYSIGCLDANFTTVASNVAPNDTVCIRHTTSPNYLETTITTLNINGVSADFSTTNSPDRDPDSFGFTSQSNVSVSSVQTSNTVTITGIGVDVDVSITGGEYSIGCTAIFSSASSTIADQQTICVRHTSSGSNNATTQTNLTVGNFSTNFSSTTEAPASSSSGSGGGGSFNWYGLLCLFSLFGVGWLSRPPVHQ
ncbi:MAG: hypothetical protein KUG78_14610 [Kangiellaceae bacterium]|nr:hypothetical protein [Kangiellaceae bacterium]